MLFDFQSYINKLRDQAEKEELINKYESLYGMIKGDITNQIWFIDYVSKFFPYYEATNCPPELEDEFDWQLLFSLMVSSFANEIELVKPDKLIDDPLQKVDVNIYVAANGKAIKKSLNELWGFHILRLYEIYCLEQIEAQILIAESEKGMGDMYSQRIQRLNFIKNYNPAFRKIRAATEDVSDNYIYHYTSFNTINEIIKGNSLRACDLKRLNDKKEYKIWFEIFDQTIERFKVKEDVELYLPILQKIVSKIYLYKELDCYVTCLSKERDLLSQWRAYGDDGQGICIAFDKKELLECLYEYNDPHFELRLLNGFLEYNYDIVFNDINTMIAELLRNFVVSNLSIDEYFNQVEHINNFDQKVEKVFMRMQDLKDSAFFEEKEFRLFWQQGKKSQLKKISSFERNKRIIPYVDLSFGNKKMPIKEIILGPALTEIEDKKENILEVLEQYGYNIENIKIEASKLPYRK